MVNQGYLQKPSGFLDRPGDLLVGITGIQVTGRMVVSLMIEVTAALRATWKSTLTSMIAPVIPPFESWWDPST